jgi:polyisoprenyl-teichoic acid--peptidoglycan teichoic acid transferase
MAQIRRANPFEVVDRVRYGPEPGGSKKKSLRGLEVFLWLLCIITLLVVFNAVHGAVAENGLGVGLLNAAGKAAGFRMPFTPPPFGGRERVTILLMGTDATNDLCDTVIVVFLNVKAHRVALLSVPRDSYVRLASGKATKLTHAFPLAKERTGEDSDGIEAVLSTVQSNLGLPIDRWVRVDIKGFEELVDAVGGVPLEVEKQMKYTDREQGLHIDLLPGFQTLNGNQAMQYVRFRNDPEGDLGRVRRQQKFLSSLSSKLGRMAKDRDLGALIGLVPRVLKHVDTDLTAGELTQMANLARSIDLAGVETKVAAGESSFIATKDGNMSIYRLDLSQIGSDVAELERLCSTVKPEPPETRLVWLEVLNGSNRDGLAAKWADGLKAKGFRVANVENATTRDHTETAIQYSPDYESTARQIAGLMGVSETNLLPCDPLRTDEVDIRIVLGAGQQAPTTH